MQPEGPTEFEVAVGSFICALSRCLQTRAISGLSEAPANDTRRSTSLLPDINALMQGMQRGRQAMQGVIPSAQNAGGAAPAQIDPMAAKLKFCHAQLMSAMSDMHRMHADQDAAKLMKAAEAVLTLILDRRKRIAKDANDAATGQANPLRLHGMGSNLNG